jgi:hypothetical protein
MEGSKGDRLKAGGGQGPGGSAGDFAGLLSLSVIVEDPAEPATDTAAPTAQTATPADNTTMDVAAMLALLVGVPASASTAVKPAGGDARMDAGDLSLADLEQKRLALPGSALPNGAKVLARSAGVAGLKSVVVRADAFAVEPASGGKAGPALSSVIAPGVDGAQAAAVVSGTNGHQSGTALAALLASGKGDGYGGGRPSDASSEPVAPSLLAVTAGMLDGSGRSSGGNSDKAPETAGKPGLEGVNPGANLAADGVGSPAAVAETPSLQISDSMLADTVSYWVSQGVQTPN